MSFLMRAFGMGDAGKPDEDDTGDRPEPRGADTEDATEPTEVPEVTAPASQGDGVNGSESSPVDTGSASTTGDNDGDVVTADSAAAGGSTADVGTAETADPPSGGAAPTDQVTKGDSEAAGTADVKAAVHTNDSAISGGTQGDDVGKSTPAEASEDGKATSPETDSPAGQESSKAEAASATSTASVVADGAKNTPAAAAAANPKDVRATPPATPDKKSKSPKKSKKKESKAAKTAAAAAVAAAGPASPLSPKRSDKGKPVASGDTTPTKTAKGQPAAGTPKPDKGAQKQQHDKPQVARQERRTTDHPRPAFSRVLVVADVRGNLSLINELAARAKASAVITTGNFGFYDDETPNSFLDKRTVRKPKFGGKGFGRCGELPRFLRGEAKFNVPVYTVWGSQADVRVICKFRTGEYSVPNLFILDELHSYKVGNLRLFGLGGSVDEVKLFDNGKGTVDAIAGKDGRMWTTLLQLGQLATQPAAKQFSHDETRVLVTHVRPSLNPLITSMAVALKCDVTVGDNSPAPMTTWFNEASVGTHRDIQYKAQSGKEDILDLWSQVEEQVLSACNPEDVACLKAAVQATTMPVSERYFRFAWHLGVSSRRDMSAVLLVSENGVGLDTFAPVIEVRKPKPQPDRQWHARVAKLRAHHTVVVTSDRDWAEGLSVGEVRSAFLGAGCRPSFVLLPVTPSEPIYIEFESPAVAKKATHARNLTLQDMSIVVKPHKPRSDADEDWRGAPSSSPRGNASHRRESPRKGPSAHHQKGKG